MVRCHVDYEWVCVRLTSGISRAFSMRTILTVSPPHWVSVSPSAGSGSGCISLSAMLSCARSNDCKTHRHAQPQWQSLHESFLYLLIQLFSVCVCLPESVRLTAGCAVQVPLCSDSTGWDSWPVTRATTQHITGTITLNIGKNMT